MKSVETQIATRWWGDMGGEEWAAHYWNSRNKRHRAVLMALLDHVQPFGTLLEVGCNAGPNLRLVHERWPHVALVGVDINAVALSYLQARASEDGWADRLHLLADDICEALPVMVSNLYSRFDVVVSSYTLAYLAPGDWHLAMRALLELSYKAVIFMEPMLTDPAQSPMCGRHEYRHDYVGFLRAFPLKIQTVAIDPAEGQLNQAVLVTA